MEETIVNNRYYLYRHIRLDINQVFYVGIGTNYTVRNYKRAYTKNKRSDWWNKVVNKTEYEVEILLETDDKELIFQKEKEFILLYGRIKLQTGSLVNLTDGGDGAIGRPCTILSKKQAALNSIKAHKANEKEVIQYDLNNNYIKTWESMTLASNSLQIHRSTISKCASGKLKTAKNYVFRFEPIRKN